MLAGKNSVTATPLDSPGRADIEEPEDLPTALMNRQRIQAEALGDQAVAVDKRFLVEQEHESLTQQLTVAVGEIEALTREREALALDNKAWQLAALRHEESLVRERNKSARLENENFALQERVRELEAMLSNKKDPRGAGMEVPTFRDSSSEASRLRSELEAETAGLVSAQKKDDCDCILDSKSGKMVSSKHAGDDCDCILDSKKAAVALASHKMKDDCDCILDSKSGKMVSKHGDDCDCILDSKKGTVALVAAKKDDCDCILDSKSGKMVSKHGDDCDCILDSKKGTVALVAAKKDDCDCILDSKSGKMVSKHGDDCDCILDSKKGTVALAAAKKDDCDCILDSKSGKMVSKHGDDCDCILDSKKGTVALVAAKKDDCDCILDSKSGKMVPLRPIAEIGRLLGLDPDEELEPYGKYKAKVAGEGKTTTTVGLTDALRLLGKNAVACLREPSLGPVFGMKGGAAGGGWSQVVPMADINLHFTGDFHAITSAHNLLSAMVDNHIYWKKSPELDTRRVTWKRVLDMNDRALRKVTVALGGAGNGYPREDGFDITVASEVMAILCLSTDTADLERRLGNIIVGYTRKRDPVTCRELKAAGAMAALLKDAFKPNLVQTLGGSPAFVHGGPFANIAHGCNSVVATKLGLDLGEYAVTEAGFGADLGAEKFVDIKCRASGLQPDCVVLVVSCRALKMHGGVAGDGKTEDLEAIKVGLANVERHCENLAKFQLPIVVSVNKFPTDSAAELRLAVDACREFPNVRAASVADHWAQGGKGILEVAEAVAQSCGEEEGSSLSQQLYPSEMPLLEKIETVAREIYRAKGVALADEAKTALKGMQEKGYGGLPVCIAKTQYSFSDDAKKINAAVDHELHVQEVRLNAGAEFVVVVCGAIMTMPGLPAEPAAQKIGVVDGEIQGLF
eukprot:g18441.t1